MKKLQILFFYLVFLFILFFDFLCFCNASELTEICQQASALPGRIRSYQFSAKIELNASPDKKTDIVKFWQSGDNIRVESKMVVPPGKTVDPIVMGAIYAYNGSRYQWYIPGREALSFSKQCRHPSLYWVTNPILMPYGWLASGVVNWSDLKDRERWLAQFEKARYKGKKTENNKTFDVVSFHPPPNAEDLLEVEEFHVYFSKDLDYYPMKLVAYGKNKQLFSTMEVLQYTLLKIDGQKTVFPLVVIGVEGNNSLTMTIEESSIKVNHHIEEDLFTLSPSIAKTVYDYDEELKKIDPASESYSDDIVRPSKWTRKRFFVLIVANIIIVTIIIILVYKQRKGKK
jgi:hypothetical protein